MGYSEWRAFAASTMLLLLMDRSAKTKVTDKVLVGAGVGLFTMGLSWVLGLVVIDWTEFGVLATSFCISLSPNKFFLTIVIDLGIFWFFENILGFPRENAMVIALLYVTPTYHVATPALKALKSLPLTVRITLPNPCARSQTLSWMTENVATTTNHD